MQTALIWGAAGGIGRALVDTLSEHGWRVLGIARDASALSGAAAEVYSADLARDADVAAAALWAAQQSEGTVDLWVYAAGDMLGKPLADTTPAEWDRILSANITGAHLAVTHSLALVPAGGASGIYWRLCGANPVAETRRLCCVQGGARRLCDGAGERGTRSARYERAGGRSGYPAVAQSAVPLAQRRTRTRRCRCRRAPRVYGRAQGKSRFVINSHLSLSMPVDSLRSHRETHLQPSTRRASWP